VRLGLRVGLNVIADDFVHGQNISNLQVVCQLFWKKSPELRGIDDDSLSSLRVNAPRTARK